MRGMRTMIRGDHRRHLVLALFGLFNIMWAIAVVREPINPEALLLHEHFLPPSARVFIWGFTGAVALIASTRTKWHEMATFAVVLMPLERAISYLYSGVVGLLPVTGGDVLSLPRAGMWLSLCGVMWATSHWPCPRVEGLPEWEEEVCDGC